jgi:hypothetical protein
MAGTFEGDFSYGGGPVSVAEKSVSLAIFADRLHLRASLRDDATAAGVRVLAAGPLQDLLDAPSRTLGDIVLIDCPQADARTIAALSELDLNAAGSRARLIVSTTVEALDPVFACMDQSAPTLLVDPDRADRVLALGRALAEFPSSRLRELSDEDRLMLLRLTEQIGQIAGRLDNLAPGSGAGFEEPVSAFSFGGGMKLGGTTGDPQGKRQAPPPLPDARLVRGIIRQRQLRARFLEGGLFSDPAWEMLLDLTAARVERKRVSVTSLCIASGAPPTTALRWIGQMVEAGLFVRVCDDSDRRRAFIELTEKAAEAMARYFSEISLTAPVPV